MPSIYQQCRRLKNLLFAPQNITPNELLVMCSYSLIDNLEKEILARLDAELNLLNVKEQLCKRSIEFYTLTQAVRTDGTNKPGDELKWLSDAIENFTRLLPVIRAQRKKMIQERNEFLSECAKDVNQRLPQYRPTAEKTSPHPTIAAGGD